MNKENQHYPSIDDLAFEGRNKEYGAYFLRKKYFKHLLISIFISTFLFLLIVSVPILIDYFQGVEQPYEFVPFYVDYAMAPPSADDMNTFAKSLPPPPPPPAEKSPIVVDSVPKEEKKVEEVKPEPEKETPIADSAKGSGAGNNEQGTGNGDDTGIYTTIDAYPRYPGGEIAKLAFLRSQMHYPQAAIKAGIHGVVMVVFVIEKNGTVSNVEVSGGIGGGCNEEAVRVVKMLVWEPCKRNGKPMRVMVKMPIVFGQPGKTSK